MVIWSLLDVVALIFGILNINKYHLMKKITRTQITTNTKNTIKYGFQKLINRLL